MRWASEHEILGLTPHSKSSLDMFIFKLRKKLENDPKVLLVNVHGKGYKLQIPISGNNQWSISDLDKRLIIKSNHTVIELVNEEQALKK